MTSIAIAQSTPTAAAIGAIVSRNYPFGDPVECGLLRRGFNHVYGLRFPDGRRVVARLSAERPRGEPNVAYEAALLRHLGQHRVPVATCLPTARGADSIVVALPEGDRALMLFEHLDGDTTSDAEDDVQAFGAGLAALHCAAASYAGPASRYRLDLDHLISRPLELLLATPTMTAELRPQFRDIATRLRERIEAAGELTEVACHGDAHGSNNFITTDAEGRKIAAFFDFDDCGPGHLAYELSVYPWSLHPRRADAPMSDKALANWKVYLRAYREVACIRDQDLRAVPAFIAARHFWLMGEYAGRIPVWGSQAMPTSWLRLQVQLFADWESLELPQ